MPARATVKRRIIIDGKDFTDAVIDYLALESGRHDIWSVDIRTTTGTIHLKNVSITKTVEDGVYVTTMNSDT